MLEAALKENTETMRELIAVLSRDTLPNAQADAKSEAKQFLDKAKAEGEKSAPAAKPAAAPKAATPKAAAAPKAAAPAPAAAKTADTTGYAPVEKAILDAVADGHRKAIVSMLAEYDAKSGKDLDPSVYGEVLEKIGVITGEGVEALA